MPLLSVIIMYSLFCVFQGRKVHRSIVRQLRKESSDDQNTGINAGSPTSPVLPPLISQLQQGESHTQIL